MPSSTLIQLRRALGASLDDLRVDAVVASSTTTITSAGFQDQTANASANRYDGQWLYIATGALAGSQRWIAAGGLAPSTGVATLHIGYGTAPAVGVEFELTSRFPAIEQVGPTDTSYRTVINRALQRLAIPDRITLPVTTSDRYALTTYPWLDRPGRLTGIFEPGVTGGRATDAGWRGFRLVRAASGASLEVNAPFGAASGNLTLEVLRPAYTLVNDAESTVGLVADTDYVNISTADALPAMLAEAYSVLMGRTPGRPSVVDYAALWKEHLELAQASIYWDRTLEQERRPAAQSAPREAA